MTVPRGEGIVRIRFETVFLVLVWVAVILLVVFYPHLSTH